MSWNGQQFNRPLVMLWKESLETLCKTRGYEPTDEVETFFPTHAITPELALVILLTHNRVEDAVNLLASAIMPRVGVWWAYRCMEMVQKDIAQDFAKDGLTPKERRAKAHKELVDKLTDRSDIDAMIAAQKEAEAKLVKELEEKARKREYLNPLERVQLKMHWAKQMQMMLKRDYPAEVLNEEPGPAALAMRQRKEAALAAFRQYVDAVKNPPPPPEVPADIPRSSRIFDAIRAKCAAIKPAVDKEMAKYFPLKLHGIPAPPSKERISAAKDAALRWLLVPSDENGQRACQAAIAAKQGPESMLAYAAFWSSTNLKTETGMAPANPALPPMGISKTLLQLALLEGGDMDYDERYRRFLEMGIECADGSSTWNGKAIPEEKFGKGLRNGAEFGYPYF